MILVLTYAKVCTTSITELLTAHFPGEVFSSHGLEAWLHEPLAQALALRGTTQQDMPLFHTEAPGIARRLADALAAGESVTIVSGVRDPIARSLSVAMQNLEADFADCLAATAEATAEALATRIRDLWLRNTPDGDPNRLYLERMIRAPLIWFGEEIGKSFGFDLGAHDFDRERGYSILIKGNIRLLLFRHESAPTAIQSGLAELFPGMEFCLPHSNDGTAKPTSEIYGALKGCFRLPRPALQEIYAHPDVSRYYGADEIAGAIERWAEDGPVHLPAMPHQSFAATVFIPLRNHAVWIGQQLDSLFSQWRSDIELVLIDDGSDDGSFSVALERLASRPDVAATVMRNSQAMGHGMLPSLAAFSRAPLFIQADSDDIALPGRLDTIIDHFAANPDCRLFTSNAVLLSEAGVPISLSGAEMPDTDFDDPSILVDRQTEPCWLGASSAYHRSVIEAFPPLDPELCPYGLDLLTGFRATLLGIHHYRSRPLVGWRQHAGNSHRVSGWLGADIAGQEHSAALKLMVCAQRLRDLAWLQTQGRLDPVRAAATETRWNADFLAQADLWMRTRNRLTGTHAASAPRTERGTQGSGRYIPAIPPVITLLLGRDYPVAGAIGSVLSGWGGFHTHEGNWNWTSRQAIVVLRIPEAASQSLLVTLQGVPYRERQSIFLSMNFAEAIEVKLACGQTASVAVPLPRREDRQGDLFTLWIHAPDAVRPTTVDPSNSDSRLIGTAVFGLKVV
ncbi:glycosyltransferase [Azospirillum sp. Sh1]|uniref:glycosyltransferase n=1 Tax=Azospirillum sp. Sh1 TaxID=2607285 RepID=UPI0011EE32E5|nr:glycosyltransferase [Azospirillum sp. Sh1]KAA0582973.1 glycosyltransferase [Azospirillum sp. Sh1]